MKNVQKAPAKPSGKKNAATETSQSIAEQTRKFLASGGTVTKINIGVSGQPLFSNAPSTTKKHITL